MTSQSEPLAEPLCELCEADLAFNEHHLIPRHCHRKNWWKRSFTKVQMQRTILVCKMCHDTIHRLVPDEKELGRHFYTIEKLRSHPAIAKYVEWKGQRRRA